MCSPVSDSSVSLYGLYAQRAKRPTMDHFSHTTSAGPPMAFTHLQHRYARALQEYLGNPLECTLRNAQILGSEAHAEGLTVTQMNAIPQQAIHDILPGLLNEAKTPVEKGRRQRSDIEIVSDTHASAAQNGSPSALSPAETFFAETMSSFDAGIRDARESLAALGHQKSAFENRSRRVGREICDCIQQTLALIHLELDKLGPTFSPDGDSPLT